jgi:hypothetical protein
MKRLAEALFENMDTLLAEQKENDKYTTKEVAAQPFGTLRYQVLGRNVSDITVKLAAAVLDDSRRLLYAEFVGSTSEVKAIMGAMTEQNKRDVWTGAFPGEYSQRINLPASFMRIVDSQIKVPEVRTIIHHAAALEPGGLLVLTANRRDLWRRIVASVTTPVFDKWHKSLMPAVLQRRVAVPCHHFGLPKNIEAWYIDKDATANMDKIVSAHVRQHKFN